MYSGGQGVYTDRGHARAGAPRPRRASHRRAAVAGTDPAVTVHQRAVVQRLPAARDAADVLLRPRSASRSSTRSTSTSWRRAAPASSPSCRRSRWRAYMHWRELQPQHRFDIVHDVQALGYGTLDDAAPAACQSSRTSTTRSRSTALNQMQQAHAPRMKIRRAMFYPFFMQEVVARRMDRIITGSHNSRASVQHAFALRDGRSRRSTTASTRRSSGRCRDREASRAGCSSSATPTTATRARRYLLEAVTILRDRGVDFHLTSSGPARRRDGAAHGARARPGDRVTFLGRLPLEELVRVYNDARDGRFSVAVRRLRAARGRGNGVRHSRRGDDGRRVPGDRRRR